MYYIQYCILKNEYNEVQGLVKPGSNLAAVINTAKKDVEELTKKLCCGSMGRHKGCG